MQKYYKPIEIKISTIVAISVVLYESNLVILKNALNDITHDMSDLFDDEFAICDIGALKNIDINWKTLISLFKCFKLNIIAVRNAPLALHSSITAQGLNIDNTTIDQSEILKQTFYPRLKAFTQSTSPILSTNITDMIIDTPVRTGQRIYARGCNLIIMATINSGAEIIADGSIHIYALLRGRALAGANGNIHARIFVLNLEAELVSIAGIYRTFENGYTSDLIQQPVQICLNNNHIDILPINIKKLS